MQSLSSNRNIIAASRQARVTIRHQAGIRNPLMRSIAVHRLAGAQGTEIQRLCAANAAPMGSPTITQPVIENGQRVENIAAVLGGVGANASGNDGPDTALRLLRG